MEKLLHNKTLILCFTLLSLISAGQAVALPVASVAGCVYAPDLSLDSIPLCPDTPGLGDPILIPGAEIETWRYRVYVEDLVINPIWRTWGNVDGADFNDSVFDVYGSLSGDIYVEWADGNSYFKDKSSVVYISGAPVTTAGNPGPHKVAVDYVPGAELVFHLLTPEGQTWVSGHEGRNSDVMPHFLVKAGAFTSTPEPGTYALMLTGFSALLILARRRRNLNTGSNRDR
jgi:hypothetical protein